MRSEPLITYLLLSAISAVAQDQKTSQPAPQKIVCGEQSAACVHKLVNGFTYETLGPSDAVVTVSLADNGKYTRLEVGVTNAGQKPFDVLPVAFAVSVTAPKPRLLRMVPPEKIIASARHHAGWANALNAMGAGMASQQVTTQTNSSGTVQATGSDGSYANGTYNGNSTSTTSVPDYAAQARARENIARRRAALAAQETEMNQTVLRANTVDSGKSLSGFVYFDSEKHGTEYIVDVPIGGIVYEFPIDRPKH